MAKQKELHSQADRVNKADLFTFSSRGSHTAQLKAATVASGMPVVIDLEGSPEGKKRPLVGDEDREGSKQARLKTGVFEEEDDEPADAWPIGSPPAYRHSVGSGPPQTPPPPTPICRCKLPCVLETSESNANYGREYFKCGNDQGKCGFFQWVDQPAKRLSQEPSPIAAYQGGLDFNDPADEDVVDQLDRTEMERQQQQGTAQLPLCQCGLQAVKKVSQSEKNPNRAYFTCPQDYRAKCNFFEWVDAPAKISNVGDAPASRGPADWNPQGSHQETSHVVCQCQPPEPAKLLTSQSAANPNRKFYKCSKPQGEQCRFFQWADELKTDQNRAAIQTPGRDGGWGASTFGGAGGPSRVPGGGGKSGNCYICGEPGHWSSACPAKGSGRGGRGSGSASGGFRSGGYGRGTYGRGGYGGGGGSGGLF